MAFWDTFGFEVAGFAVSGFTARGFACSVFSSFTKKISLNDVHSLNLAYLQRHIYLYFNEITKCIMRFNDFHNGMIFSFNF